jgi:superfamily II DNA or RNA helicase
MARKAEVEKWLKANRRQGEVFDMGPERRVINPAKEREREAKEKERRLKKIAASERRDAKEAKTGKRTAVLDYRLFVPAKFVTDSMKDEYTFVIPDAKPAIDEYGEPVEDTNEYVLGYKYHKKEKLYSFARGDRAKMDRVFRSFKIEDNTAAPPLRYPIRFKGVRVGDEYLPLRPDQIRVIKAIRKVNYGILVAPPRFGKTTVMSRLVTKYGVRTILFVHQIDLARQFVKEFKRCTDVSDIERRTGRTLIGIARTWEDVANFDICVITWQKFHAGKGGKQAIARFRDRFGLTLVDEGHTFSSKFSSKVVGSFNSRYRIGVTATPDRKDKRDVIVKQIIGDVVVRGKTKQVPMRVRPVYTGLRYAAGGSGTQAGSAWPHQLNFIAKSETRNKFIVNNVEADVKAGHSVLVTTERRQHIDNLVERLKKKGIKVLPFHGGLKKDREDTLAKATVGKVDVIVGMRSMLTGVNVPRWSSMHITMPTANKPNAYQVFSRVRTPFEGKSVCYVNHYIDAFSLSTGCYKHCHSNYLNKEYAPVSFVDDNCNVIKTPSFESIRERALGAEPVKKIGDLPRSQVRKDEANNTPSIPRTVNSVWGWDGGAQVSTKSRKDKVSDWNAMRLAKKKKKKRVSFTD